MHPHVLTTTRSDMGHAMRYLISYDLQGPEPDYESLWDELEEMGATRVLKSQFVVRQPEMTVYDLCNHLVDFLKPGDGLLVNTLKPGDYCAWLLEADITAL